MKDTWNERYDRDEFIYGVDPNNFFARNLEPKFRGKLLLPGEGEGRNAIYAASLGWDVHAFDQSVVAASKAILFARLNKLVIEYEVNDCSRFEMVDNYYDAVGLIYLHLDKKLRREFHTRISERIKPGGMVIGEWFSLKQIILESGGPRDPSLLYSIDEIREDFKALKTIELEECMVNLNEGFLHQGMASVIRFVGVKE